MPWSAASGAARSTSSWYHELPPSMIVSPDASSGARAPIVESTNAAGTMIQTARGTSSWATNAAMSVVDSMPSADMALTLSTSMS